MHPTATGLIAEKKFALRCLELSVPVLTPLIDQNGFDYVIQRGVNYEKIQVKSTLKMDIKRPNTYRFSVKRGCAGVKYTKNDYDYLACYIFELDLFYIIPFDYISVLNIRISPFSDRCKYSRYKEAWNLILETR